MTPRADALGATAARPVTPISIAAARLADLATQFDAGSALDPDFGARLRAVAQLIGGFDDYVEWCSTPQSPELAELATQTGAHAWSQHVRRDSVAPLEQEMLSGHVEGQFLRMLVHATQAGRVLEIGTFTGYAALAMAAALPEGGHVVTCELDPDVAAIARRNFDASSLGERIELRVGPATTTLADLTHEGARFDLVFIDADKAGYAAYFHALLDGGLLGARGLLCVDNTLMQGLPWMPDTSPNGEAIAELQRGGALGRAGRAGPRPAARRGHADPPGRLMIVRPLEPVGAELEDVDLAAADDLLVDRLCSALAMHGMLAARAQSIDDAGFLRLLRRLGTPVFTVGETAVEGFADLNVVSNVGRTTVPKSTFHVDTSYVARPPAYTALRAVRVPDSGGDTLFSNQYRALDTLDPALRELIEGRTIRHVVTGVDPGSGQEHAAEHPIVREHPLSGRSALYLTTPARCAAVSGLDDEDGRRLISALYEHSTAAGNVHRHSWRPDDVVLWDNGCVLHKADHAGPDQLGVVADRVLHRGMVDGYAARLPRPA